ncbi:MAG: hypothetical protein M1536_07260 [Firmicutes bacterium]|nr:hypothetical protein [Bacillota bacterium]
MVENYENNISADMRVAEKNITEEHPEELSNNKGPGDDSLISSSPPGGDNFFSVAAEIKFSDGLLPSKGDFSDPSMYVFEGLDVVTTFKEETKHNIGIVRESTGLFIFGSRIETADNISDDDYIEEISFVKESYRTVTFKNIKINSHVVNCYAVIMDPCPGENKDQPE